eukprot:531357-Pelagomonas_calceolata.AAC.1
MATEVVVLLLEGLKLILGPGIFREQARVTNQHHHPPAARAAAGAAAPGQNTRGAMKKRRAASANQDNGAQARKIEQAMKAKWGPPRRYGTSGRYIGPPSYGNGPLVL